MVEEGSQMDRFIREPECRLRTGLARSTRWALERRGLFPKRRRLARNAVGWLESELLEWMKSRAAGSEHPPLRERVDLWPNHAGAARRPQVLVATA